MTSRRKAHREICSLCHEVSRVGFHVPDKIWKLAVHVSQLENIICLRCFALQADERGVEWDKEIEFFPVSQITLEKERSSSAARKLLAVNTVLKLINTMSLKDKRELRRKLFPELEESHVK